MTQNRRATVLFNLTLAWLIGSPPAQAQEPEEAGRLPRAELVDPETANRVEAEVVRMQNRLWDAILAGDSSEVVALIHQDATFVTAGVRKTKAQMVSTLAAIPSAGVDLELSDFHVIVLSEHEAIVNYVLEWEQVHPLIPSRMFDSMVWLEDDGRWVVLFAHDSIMELYEYVGSVMKDCQ
jgi:hypothetical protein